MISFVPSLKMAARVEEQYRLAGYRAAMVQGDMDDKERRDRLSDLGTGGLDVLVSCSLIDEGVDVKVVEAVQLLDPTKSLTRFLQRCGRGARMFPGKKGYYLLDHVCNTFLPNMEPNHGDPSWDREWTLDGDCKKKKVVATCPVRQCNLCWGVHKPAPKCPYCGHEYEVQAREIDQVDGELIAPTADQLAEAEAKQKAKQNRPVTPAKIEEWQAKTLDDFIRIGKQRGYSSGWAHRQWQIRGPKIQKNVQHKKDMARQMGFL
jgi:superfamily II DNA or RNA helicase